MMTVEKLLVQILDRKNRIIQQVKQQTDLYHQNLASKLLIDGIDPPPWLWNPNQSSSDVQKVLNKEELMSEIFLPHPQPAVGFSGSLYHLYNQSAAQETGEILDSSFKATYACRNGDTGAKESCAAGFEENKAGCGICTVPDIQVSVTSPEDEAVLRISNNYVAQEQSLVIIQRSKSRQKALELRTSAKAKRKSLRPDSTLASSLALDRSSFSGNKEVDLFNGVEDVCEPFVISRESFKGEENRESFKGEENEIVVPYDCSTNIQDKSCTQQEYNKEIASCHGIDNQPMEVFSTSNVGTDSYGTCEERAGRLGVDNGKDIKACGGRLVESSPSQKPSCLNEVPSINKLNHSAEPDEGVVCKSVGCLVKPFNDATGSSTLTDGFALEITRVQTISYNDEVPPLSYNPSFHPTDRRSESGESFVKKNKNHSTSVDEAARLCAGSNILTCPKGNFVALNGDKLFPSVLEKDLTSNSKLISESTRLECLAKTSSDCSRFLDPKQLNFDDTEGYNFNKMSCITLQNTRQEILVNEIFGNSSDPQVSCHNHIWTAQGNIPLNGQQKSSKKNESCISSFESALEEHVEGHLKECSFSPNMDSTFKACQDNSEVLCVQSSTPSHQANNKSNDLQTSGFESYLGVFSEGQECIADLHTEENQHMVEKEEKTTSVPYAFERDHLESDYHGGKDDLTMLGSVDDDKDLDPLKSSETQFPGKLQSFKRYSWPRNKRRKTEDQETTLFSASPSFRIQNEQKETKRLNKNLVGERETVLEQSTGLNNCPDEQIYPKMLCQLTRTMESSSEFIKNVGRLLSEEPMEHENILSSPKINEGEESILLTSVKEMGGVSQGCFPNGLGLADGSFSIRMDQKNNLENEALANTKSLTDAERNVLSGSYLDMDSGPSDNSVQSPAKIDPEIIGADQTMFVVEGFIIDSETLNEKVDIPGNEIAFDKLELPRTSIERANILEQICKSAGRQTPLTQISSALTLQGIHTCHLSVPNHLLECGDKKSFLALNRHVYNHIGSKSVDETKDRLHLMSCSDCAPNSKSQYGWDSQYPFTSPVGKLWEKITAHSDSSRERLSSNPELTCFPIEEDPNNSEENEDISLPERVDGDIDTVVYASTEREPLADIRAAFSNGTSSFPGAERCTGGSNLSTVATEASFKRAHNKIKGKVAKHSQSRIEEKENGILLTGANGMKKSDDSRNTNYSKISSSCATSSRTEQCKLLGKETKQNNIVSNVTSFIPLVQQKQAAAPCKGKRDVKVKALEAAEAAKRQQEKRDQERKLRKEAVKIERARVEQENLRQMELKQKKKEEERKKKDADIVAKKRAREEEERKEKERKRKHTEEARSQRMVDGKLVCDKAEKGKRLPLMDEEDTRKKDGNNELNKCKDFSKDSRDRVTFEKNDMKMTTDAFTSDVRHACSLLEACGTSHDSIDNTKVTPAINKFAENCNFIKDIQEKSYDISPYQLSEEEDDGDAPNKKFIPSWASKSCVALILPLQQEVDPNVIFPPDSFCSTSEAVLPTM